MKHSPYYLQWNIATLLKDWKVNKSTLLMKRCIKSMAKKSNNMYVSCKKVVQLNPQINIESFMWPICKTFFYRFNGLFVHILRKCSLHLLFLSDITCRDFLYKNCSLQALFHSLGNLYQCSTGHFWLFIFKITTLSILVLWACLTWFSISQQ